MKHTEYALACKTAKILDASGLLFTHVPLEEADPKRAALEARMGARAGCPDFLVFGPPPLAIELKAPRGSITREQQWWLSALAMAGWHTRVCRSTEDVLDTLREVYGGSIYGGSYEDA